MKFIFKLVKIRITRWVRAHIVAEGWQDSKGFHFGSNKNEIL